MFFVRLILGHCAQRPCIKQTFPVLRTSSYKIQTFLRTVAVAKAYGAATVHASPVAASRHFQSFFALRIFNFLLFLLFLDTTNREAVRPNARTHTDRRETQPHCASFVNGRRPVGAGCTPSVPHAGIIAPASGRQIQVLGGNVAGDFKTFIAAAKSTGGTQAA
jgi:hypothetical protein